MIWWSRCIPSCNFNGGGSSISAYQRHFSHGSKNMWRRFELSSFDKCGCQLSPFASQSLLRRIQRPYSSLAATQRKSRKMLYYLTGLVFAMVAASYAAVPLYRRFCQATGYGGTIQRREVWFFSNFQAVILVSFIPNLFDLTMICTFSLFRVLNRRLLGMLRMAQSQIGPHSASKVTELVSSYGCEIIKSLIFILLLCFPCLWYSYMNAF